MPILQNDQLQHLMQIAGIGIICWLLIRSRLNRRKAAKAMPVLNLGYNSNAKSRPTQFSGTQSLGAPAEVLKWQVELHDLGRELKAELDSKLIAVRTITQNYDRASKQLSQLIQLAEQARFSEDSPLCQVRRLAEAGWSTTKIAEQTGLPAADVQLMLPPTTELHQPH